MVTTESIMCTPEAHSEIPSPHMMWKQHVCIGLPVQVMQHGRAVILAKAKQALTMADMPAGGRPKSCLDQGSPTP